MEIDFNIAICGCISSGKSTFINGLLKFNVNKMSKIKSTLVPIIYIYDNRITENQDLINIEKNNLRIYEDLNKLQYNDTFTENNYKEHVNKISKIDDFIDIHTDLKLQKYSYSLTEIPGLNDIYEKYHLDYLQKNISNYDIIIYLIDIHNISSHDSDIKYITQINEMIKDKNINLIILINKCDDITFHNNGKVYFDDEENQESYDELKNKINNKFANNYIYCFNTSKFYIIRFVTNIDYCEEKIMDIVIKEEDGKVAAAQLETPEKKKKYLKGMINRRMNEEILNKTGYDKLRNRINGIMILKISNMYYNYYLNKTTISYDELINILHIYKYYKNFKNIDTITNLSKNIIQLINDHLYNNIYNNDIKDCDKHIELFEKYDYDLDKIMQIKFIFCCNILTCSLDGNINKANFDGNIFDFLWRYFTTNRNKYIDTKIINKYSFLCDIYNIEKIVPEIITNTIKTIKNIKNYKLQHQKFIEMTNKIYVSSNFINIYLQYLINNYSDNNLNSKDIIQYLSQDIDSNSDIYKYITHMFLNYEYNKIVKKDLTSFNECYKMAIEKVDTIIKYIKLNRNIYKKNDDEIEIDL